MKDLNGKIAIVTGASSGIGWQSAVRLAEQGVRICATARRAEALQALVRTIEDRGGECLAVPGDVSNDADVKEVVDACIERYGRIDILVNDAGVQVYDWFENLEWAEIQRLFDVTLFGYFRFARAVLPHFRRQGSGHIINVASMLSVGAAPLLSAYTSAKHAILGWAQSLRLELWGSGIDVSNILMPSVSTPMFDHAPMKLGRAPRPVPPTYDTDLAARAVVRCARTPNPKAVPVFLQGKLMLFAQSVAPWIGNVILANWGVKMQERDERIDPRHGNLFEPVPEGVGPYGSCPPTPRWKRWGAVAALLAGVGLVGAGGIAGGVRAARGFI